MYGIIHEKIFDSTLMAEGGDVPYIFMCMVTLANSDDVVDYAISAFATRINKPLEVVEHAIERLSRPDLESRSQEHDGRRIIPLKDIAEVESNRGWFVVNREEYIEMVKKEHRNNYMRELMKKKRKGEKANKTPDVSSLLAHIDIDINIDIDSTLWEEWMDVRKKKKAVNSETALKGLIRNLIKIVKSGKYTANDAMQIAIENSWKTVTLEWMENYHATNKQSNTTKPKTGADIFAQDRENIRRNGHRL